MSTQTIFAAPLSGTHDGERGHRIRLLLGYVLILSLVVIVAAYGFDYYGLNSLERPHSPKHQLLKPSGAVGIKLGMLGLAMFACIFLYPIRKRWRWLQSKGGSRHWLDFHVLLGLFAPVVIALHSSFKFQGIAGMAFWVMLSVALSGIVGRYLYSQIPRKVNSAELSLRESRELREQLVQRLSMQKLIPERELQPLFRLPSEGQVACWPLIVCLGYMMALDLVRPYRIARLRMGQLSFFGKLCSFGGLLPTVHPDLEAIIKLAREQSSLSKRIVFLSRAQQVFHLWHVVHKPFSYSFIALTLLHIGVVVALGYM